MSNELGSRLQGMVVPLVTPFTPEHELDENGFQGLIEFTLDEGAEALVACDAMGEFFSLTPAERLRVIELAVDCARGRALVIAHIGASSERTARFLGKRAVEKGADVLKLTVPYFFRPGDAAISQFARSVADGFPYMLEDSDLAPLPFWVIDQLLSDGNLIGLEVLGSDIARLDECWELFGERMSIIPSGEAVLFMLLRGAKAVIQGISNFQPATIQRLLDASASDDVHTMLDIFGRLRRHRMLFRGDAAAGMPAYVTYTKAALAMLGMPAGPVRPPLEGLDAGQHSVLRETLRQEFNLPI